MTQNPRTLVVVGHGAAGLAAALSAAEQARIKGVRIETTLLGKSREDEAGGNTSWSPTYMRMAAPDRLAPGFEDDMQRACGGFGAQGFFLAPGGKTNANNGWVENP